MRAFVTGGTGFVGSHLCEALREAGHEVRALVRTPSKAKVLKDCGCRLVRGSINDDGRWAKALRGCSVVFHLAGMTRAVSPSDLMRVNSVGTQQLLDVLVEQGFKGHFILVSSLAAAGPARAGRPVAEQDRPAPVSQYGRSKLRGEIHALQASRYFPVTILRPGSIYGPREHQIFKLIKGVSKTGLALRAGRDIRIQMTHVYDVVEALLLAAYCPPDTGSRTYFVNDYQSWLYSRVHDVISEALEREVREIVLPLIVGKGVAAVFDLASVAARRPLSPLGRDKMREVAAGSWLGDSSRIREELGWQTRIPLPEGMRQTVAWYREQGWLK